jgi:hypothetical protein
MYPPYSHIPMVKRLIKNNKYLVLHKGANKAPLHAQILYTEIDLSIIFCLESVLQEILTNG